MLLLAKGANMDKAEKVGGAGQGPQVACTYPLAGVGGLGFLKPLKKPLKKALAVCLAQP
jgi:hypothetical protein